MAWQGAGHASRGGLSSRTQMGHDQVQININQFDFDQEVDGLRAHVKKIKEMSKAIEEEQQQQGQLIHSLEESMERAKLAMKRTMRRLNIAYSQAQSNHLLFLALFAVVLFAAIYILSKVYRLGRAALG